MVGWLTSDRRCCALAQRQHSLFTVGQATAAGASRRHDRLPSADRDVGSGGRGWSLAARPAHHGPSSSDAHGGVPPVGRGRGVAPSCARSAARHPASRRTGSSRSTVPYGGQQPNPVRGCVHRLRRPHQRRHHDDRPGIPVHVAAPGRRRDLFTRVFGPGGRPAIARRSAGSRRAEPRADLADGVTPASLGRGGRRRSTSGRSSMSWITSRLPSARARAAHPRACVRKAGLGDPARQVLLCPAGSSTPPACRLRLPLASA